MRATGNIAPGDLRSLLEGGDRRSIGRSEEAVEVVKGHPERMRELVECLWDGDPVVRMRAADAAEKLTRANAATLAPFREELLGLLAEATQPELRWHLAVLIPRLRLSARERQSVAGMLRSYLEDRSSIVKTFALQGLFELGSQDETLRAEVTDILYSAARSGTPAMRARSRKLLAQLTASRGNSSIFR